MAKNWVELEQEFDSNTFSLRSLKTINKKDLSDPIWKTMNGYYKQVKDLKWKTRAAITVQNSILHQGRKVFVITKKNLGILLPLDTNHQKPLGLKSENYSEFRKYLFDLGICKKIDEVKTSKGNYMEILEVIDEELLGFLGDIDAKAQHQEILDLVNARKLKPQRETASKPVEKQKKEPIQKHSPLTLDEDDVLAKEGYMEPITPSPRVIDRDYEELLGIQPEASISRSPYYTDDPRFKTNAQLDQEEAENHGINLEEVGDIERIVKEDKWDTLVQTLVDAGHWTDFYKRFQHYIAHRNLPIDYALNSEQLTA